MRSVASEVLLVGAIDTVVARGAAGRTLREIFGIIDVFAAEHRRRPDIAGRSGLRTDNVAKMSTMARTLIIAVNTARKSLVTTLRTAMFLTPGKCF